VRAYFELQGQSRGRVGTGIFSCSVFALKFSKKKVGTLCFRAHSRMYEFVWPCFVKHGMQSSHLPKPFRLENRAKVAQERPHLEAALRQAAGSGQKWSRADFATHCAIGRGGGVLDAGSGSLRWRVAVKTVGSGCLAIDRCLLPVLLLALHS
jgi:hypothetical protein